jgi:serine/threonine-protein kinase
MDERTRRAEKRVGTVLRDRWTIDALVGVGGMAAVYKATHRNGNEVAIKVLHADISSDSGIRKRFAREGYAANRVKHRGAVTVFDDDVTEGGSAFLVMELLHGENIEARRERLGGFIPLPEVLGIADQVLDTLAAAHEQGIVHRDIKPENLFLTTDGVVKVLDFGIARLHSTAEAGTGLTVVGAMLGTPGFLAPEQARGMTLAIDHQTDLWAVGATLFTLLCGRHVEEAETAEESMARAATNPARSIASVLPNLDASVAAWVDRALAWEKRDRFPDARSMQEELRRLSVRVLQASGASSARLELDETGALSGPILPSEREPPTRVMYVPDEPNGRAGAGTERDVGVGPPTAPVSEEPPTRRRSLPSLKEPRPSHAPPAPRPSGVPKPLGPLSAPAIAAIAGLLLLVSLGMLLLVVVLVVLRIAS